MQKYKPLVFTILCLLCLSGIAAFSTVKSQISQSALSINADGSITPSTAPITVVGNVYTLTANISASMLVHRSNIMIDGAGFALLGSGGTGIDLTNNITQVPSPQEIWNVTIKNLAILGFHFGVNTNGGGNNTLYDDYVLTSMSDSSAAVLFWDCSGNNVSYCNLVSNSTVEMQFGSNHNSITKNNIDGNVWVEMVANDETVDGNYWSDYLTVYPNATEIAGTGIGNTPYAFYNYTNTQSGLSKTPLYDHDPQINPVVTPLFSTLTVTHLASAVPELSSLVILPLLLSVFSVAVIVSIRKPLS